MMNKRGKPSPRIRTRSIGRHVKVLFLIDDRWNEVVNTKEEGDYLTQLERIKNIDMAILGERRQE